jgi:hypothetical protein
VSKPGEQEFVGIAFKKTVKQGAGKGHANILLRNMMFKSGLMEQVVAEHNLNIAQIWKNRNTGVIYALKQPVCVSA